MRRFLFLFVFIATCLNAISRDVVTKLVQQYEVNQPAKFWSALSDQHPQKKEMLRALDERKPAMRRVSHEIGDLSNLRILAKNEALPYYSSLISELYKITGVQDAFKKVELFVISDPEPNAGMYPEGTCIINTGLIDKSENMEEIVAVVAHEIAHYALSHAINDMWRTAKAVNRNKKWADLGTVLAVGAYGASQIHSAQYGVQHSAEAQQQMYGNIISAGASIRDQIGLRTDVFTRLRYMRETEAEADETAFWFLEKNSIDPIHLINFLRRLEEENPSDIKERKKNAKFSNHPDMVNRIETLELMYKKYHKPFIDNNPLPGLSSLKPSPSSLKQEFTSKKKEPLRGTLYFDKTNMAHYSLTCKVLSENGFDRAIELGFLSEVPCFCKCVGSDLQINIFAHFSDQ